MKVLHRYAIALVATLLGFVGVSCGESASPFQLGASAVLDIFPTAIDFGDVPRGQEARQNVTVRHVGTGGTIVLDPILMETSSPDLSIGVIERTQLKPGEESRIQVVYQSNEDAPDAGELVIGTNVAHTPELRVPVASPGQRAKLSANPNAIDFGVVQGGVTAKITVHVVNAGSAPATITSWEIKGDADGDFGTGAAEGTVIGVAESVPVDLLYTPAGSNADTAVIQFHTEREDVTLSIPMEGEEESPVLIVQPSTVQFGWIEPGGNKLVTVKIRNDGNKDLTIEDFELEDDTGTVSIVGALFAPFSLVPGDGVNLGLLYQPLMSIPMTIEPLATLVIRSTDVLHDPYNVPCFGAAGVPGIEVIPSDAVDFAYVAEGFKGERTVTVINVGSATVAITDAELVDETTWEFKFHGGSDYFPVTLAPGESHDLLLSFDNQGGDEGTEFARFIIHTTDELVPQYPLDVVARRSERPTCEPAFVPEILAMGAHKSGTVATGTMKVANYGSGNCVYQTHELLGCNKVQADVRHLFDCDPNFPWTPFEMSYGPAFGTLLGPGQFLTFDVSFNAPEVYNMVVGRDSYYARLALVMHDPNIPGPKLVAPPGGWMAGVNLRAESGLPMVSVDPPLVDFGLVRTDCESDIGFVAVSNIGPMTAQVTGVELIGCDDQVLIKNMPDLPAEITGFDALYLEITYAPTFVGDHSCQMKVTTDSLNVPEAEITLVGQATDVTHQIDSYLQVPPPKVDVLFVVDDSMSMADEQLVLKQELPKLVQIAMSWGQDYHLAATTTDTVLVQGKFKGVPPYADASTPVDEFADNLLVGIAGYFEEMGLESAWMALSGINTSDSGITCIDAPNQCPVGLTCKENVCRGPNWGFMRPDAELVIILISDEEDSSPESVNWYVSHFAALKTSQSGYGVKLHAIIYPPEGCPGANWGSVGYRYIQAVKAYDGHTASICADSFADEFEEIGNQTFGLKDQFYPSLPPDPETLVVTVNGEVCTEGWTWNPITSAVVFEEDGVCYPPYGAEVTLEYDVYCATAEAD